MQEWTLIANCIKPNNLKGRLVVRPATGVPFLLYVGMNVNFVPPQADTPRTAIVSEVTQNENGEYWVYFSGIDDMNLASNLQGCSILVDSNDIHFPSNQVTDSSIIGFAVQDTSRGIIGSVSDYIEKPAQNLICVSGEYGEVLIPYVEEFVVNVIFEDKIICVDIPDGLFGLN